MAEVLVLDGGGRGQAIKQAMEGSSEVSRVEVATDPAKGLELFGGGPKPFVIVGPEALLAEGAADWLRDQGCTVLGASKEAAKYEASKARAVRMARRAEIIHPDTFIAEDSWIKPAAREYVEGHHPLSYVIKADGLAAGKGTDLPETYLGAMATVNGNLDGSLNSWAGSEKLLFARRVKGPEGSAMVLVGGGKDDFVVWPLSQDHKRLKDGDEGPNTGGMGAYAPMPESIVDAKRLGKVYEKAYQSLKGMEDEGVKYGRAVLYMGLMWPETPDPEVGDDSWLIEYNVRFGDPEVQALLPLLAYNGIDAYRMLRSAAEGQIETDGIDFSQLGGAAISVCLAASGYPGEAHKEDEIHGLDKSYDGVTVQLAGATKGEDGVYRTSGGASTVRHCGR